MTPSRLVWPGDVATALTKAGCAKIAATEPDFEVWMADYGFSFIVPTLGPDRLCPQIALTNILREVEERRNT